MDCRKLTSAILLLTKELKRYNDAQTPPKPRKRSEAELFTANFSAEEIARREESARLSLLRAAGDRKSDSEAEN